MQIKSHKRRSSNSMNPFIYSQNLPSFSHSRKQSGATLIIVLVLLILITLFGMASVRGSLLQERMVSGTIANTAGFQAAEAGLRQGEAKLAGFSAEELEGKFPSQSNTCENGFCSKYVPEANKPPPWAASGFWDSNKTMPNTEAVGSGTPLEVTPKYVIEDFGKGESGSSMATDRGTAFEPPAAPPAKLYRITAYAQAPSTDAETILQSIFIR